MRNLPSKNSSPGGHSRNFNEINWSPFVKSGFGISPNRSYALVSLLILFIVGAFISTRLLLDPTNIPNTIGGVIGKSPRIRHVEIVGPIYDFPVNQLSPATTHNLVISSLVLNEKEGVTTTTNTQTISPKYPRPTTVNTQKPPESTLDCPPNETTGTCPRNKYPTTTSFREEDVTNNHSPTATCPDYFRWIHEDLRPWASTGITREALERAKKTANFRLAIVGGRLYIEKFQDAFQTRDVFTIWGFLQLLRKYPGKIPDLELMFDCVDWPVLRTAEFSGVNAPSPPPLFRYCGNEETLDIVFPDWSFWGWSELNIKPWDSLLKELKEGNQRTNWINREPCAYWKGNPMVAETRQDLMKCNVTEEHDWNARLYAQDWIRESKEGYKQSDLASQCHHRYKIYIEGSAWSVSEKYILACDSVTLLVKPHYYDFFTRGLLPAHHYWPVREHDKCRSIKFAVEWGNSHKEKAQEIGKTASNFIQQELKMDYVYDYMYHLLTEYSRLLRFKPQIPQNAVEICSETMACPRSGNERKFMMESLVKRPAESGPCAMPPPYDPASFYFVVQRKQSNFMRILQWEMKYWSKQNQTGS